MSLLSLFYCVCVVIAVVIGVVAGIAIFFGMACRRYKLSVLLLVIVIAVSVNAVNVIVLSLLLLSVIVDCYSFVIDIVLCYCLSCVFADVICH